MRLALLVLLLASTAGSAFADDSTWTLETRSRRPSAADPAVFEVVENTMTRDPKKTALIVCDVWDTIYCRSAADRINEMAPVINQVVAKAREQGALIIHAPSGTMTVYEGHPARVRAQTAPKAADLPQDMDKWCYQIPSEEGGVYPLDQTGVVCDEVPPCKLEVVYTKGNPAIEIKDEDAISDSGVEIWNLLADRGIEQVMIAGVHTNMCILGRSFGLRNLSRNGKDVVLIRDLTDPLYNSRSWPHVSHDEATNRIIEHIEKFVAPTILSTSITGLPPFAFKPDKRPLVAFLIGEDEYKTEETLPEFAAKELEPLGARCAFVIADPNAPNDFPGIEDMLDQADLLVVSVRRRAPTESQMKAIRRYIEAGKPVVGVRTACHAFDTRGKTPPGHADWPTFDPDVIGGNYTGHHPNNIQPTITHAASAQGHPILEGVEPSFVSKGSLYKVNPLASSTRPLLMGEIADQPAEPVAWVNLQGSSRVFYTSLGHPDDFANPSFRRLLRNAIFWTIGRQPPALDAHDGTGPLEPEEAVKAFKTPDDLAVDLVLSEPIVRQPVNMHFDERGRLWVVQYLQYPHPAGLKLLSRDGVWRASYDKVPPPPPHNDRGLDKITIHEDTNGDGVFDSHKTFVEGLNITSSVAVGRGGVWVLNPPYLLFYPDRDGDDVPDGDPEVHLQGFGLEDSHSIVNSLTWGPDGWLYGAQGSTVSGHVSRPGLDDGKEPIHSLGQLIWRYHPEKRIYEVFAEGGGNAFGVEIDSKGRVYSGHNGGDTRGFHYVQGGYFQKGFDKHGPLSNPYAFGYFPAMKHAKTPRFTHDFTIYEGGVFPSKYKGVLFGTTPLLNHVVMSRMIADGSTFRTEDVGLAMETADHWFRPVDITLGPDGCLYVADWYDGQVQHRPNHEGQLDAISGRIYRIRPHDWKPGPKLEDMGKLSSQELVDRLNSPNRWTRQTALRLIGDRKDASIASALKQRLGSATGQGALETLWALNLVGGLDEPTALKALDHADPFVRLWAARLVCDDGEASAPLVAKLAKLAETDKNVEVRSQLAASARKLPARDCLAIVANLMNRAEDVDDPHIPLLLWWAVEAKATTDPEAVLALFADKRAWDAPIAASTIEERLMRRFAAAGGRKDLGYCVRLFESAPGPEHAARLMTGLEAAYQGRSLTDLPPALADALAKHGGKSILMGLRQAKPEAIAEAFKELEKPNGDREKQLQYLRVLGEVRVPDRQAEILGIATQSPVNPIRSAALQALVVYDDPKIADAVLASYGSLSDDIQAAAQNLLASRRSWALKFLEAVDAGHIDRRTIPREVAARFFLLKNEQITKLAERCFGPIGTASANLDQSKVAELTSIIRAGVGVPKAGKAIYMDRCDRCHMLFGKGGNVGPDLTAFRRDDLGAMLPSIVSPSAEIREGYAPCTIATTDGRILSGVLIDQDDRVVVLRAADGADAILARDDIDEIEPSSVSIMPEGLLDGLDDQQLRDLFAYLRIGQPLVD